MMMERLGRLGPRERAFLTVGSLIILALLADRFVARPVLRTFAGLRADAEQQAMLYRYNRDVLAGEESVRAAYAAAGRVLGRSGTRSEAIDSLKGQIDDLAAKCGIVVHSTDHREPEGEGPYDQYDIDIKRFTADMRGLLTFLYEIQAAPGMLRVERMTLQPRREEGRLEGSMLISKVTVSAVAR